MKRVPKPAAPVAEPRTAPCDGRTANAGGAAPAGDTPAMRIGWRFGGDAQPCRLAAADVSFDANADYAGTATALAQRPSVVIATADGFGIVFHGSADRAFVARRAVNGVPFAGPSGGVVAEDRYTATVRDARDDEFSRAHALTVSVNPNGKCFLDGETVRDDEHAQCSVNIRTPLPDGQTPDPNAAPDTRCVSAGSTFCGVVFVKWPAYFAHLRPQPRPVWYHGAADVQSIAVCAAFTDRDQPATGSCARVAVRNDNAALDGGQMHGSYSVSEGSGAQTSSKSSPAKSSTSRRLASDTRAQTAVKSSDPSLLLNGTVVVPLFYNSRVSTAISKFDTSALLGRLSQNVSAVSEIFGRAQDGLVASNLVFGCPKPPCTDTSFGTLDAAAFGALAEQVRPGNATSVSAMQMDLKPIDFTSIPTVNFGSKLVLSGNDVRGGLAWYRDVADGLSGGAAHAEARFGTSALLGVTEVVASGDPSKYKNKYEKLSHTSNLVLAGTAHLAQDGSLDLFGRYGSTGDSRDLVGAVSYAPTGAGIIANAAGSHWKPHATVGYRAIDPGYAPLGTPLDPFVGTRSAFASAGVDRVPAKQSLRDPAISLTLSGARSWDETLPRFSAVVASAGFSVSSNTTLSFTHVRSSLASSVFSRQSGSVMIAGPNADAFLRNDQDTLKLTYSYTDAVKNTWTFGAGPAWTNVPAKCVQPAGTASAADAVCTSAYSRKLTYDAKFNGRIWGVDLSGDLAPQQQLAFNQKIVASNTFDPKWVVNYWGACSRRLRIEPTFTWDANAAVDGSAFVPGHLFESVVDVGLSPKNASVLRFSYKRSFAQGATPVAFTDHAFYVTVASDAETVRFANACAERVKPPTRGPATLSQQPSATP